MPHEIFFDHDVRVCVNDVSLEWAYYTVRSSGARWYLVLGGKRGSRWAALKWNASIGTSGAWEDAGEFDTEEEAKAVALAIARLEY